jgi:hypothetical protein
VFFACRHRKNKDKCLVGIQCKLFGRTRITTKIVEEEVDKIERALGDYPVVFEDCSTIYPVIIVTASYLEEEISQPEEFSQPMEVDEPNKVQNYIVLDREQLQKFFPRPLRDYTFRTICGRLNINCADANDIQPLFNLDEKQTQEFCATREQIGGFKTVDDLLFEVTDDQLALIEF